MYPAPIHTLFLTYGPDHALFIDPNASSHSRFSNPGYAPNPPPFSLPPHARRHHRPLRRNSLHAHSPQWPRWNIRSHPFPWAIRYRHILKLILRNQFHGHKVDTDHDCDDAGTGDHVGNEVLTTSAVEGGGGPVVFIVGGLGHAGVRLEEEMGNSAGWNTVL